MTEEVTSQDDAIGVSGEQPALRRIRRQRSAIAFPYVDYDAAHGVAVAIHGNVGHGTCSANSQLAAWMNQSWRSSSFRTQIAAARLFGLIESDGAAEYRLTELGTRVVDPAQARSAKAEAFLNVPLFAALEVPSIS